MLTAGGGEPSRQRLRQIVVLLAALALCALTARLGLWQLDRAARKLELQTAMQVFREQPALTLGQLPADAAQAQTQQHRLVHLQGRWLPAHTVYLDNRQMHGRPGFFALTPLQLPDGSVLLVQRGWLPRDLQDRTRIHLADLPASEVSIAGRIATGPARLYEFDAAASGVIRQNLDLADFARETALPLRPWMVVQEGAPVPLRPAAAGPASGLQSDDGLLRDWPAPAADVHKHYGYAFQWFALSALTACLYVWFQIIRPRRHAARASIA